ncbi:MAG: TetR/AcrR family transcriptional regulator [Nocardia sp.]|uniref:TetR/AcrR family transcriptional regulator n=1 Tax=Nocardia sp. TaxID=1821 RepID=UPI00260484C5|nr:TetR/AcrR family transcriptional regulator [Nocardia sp.]MCU1645006.1 TetR/AcrR family transcriptional regulator [Nocardia sp.]
MSLNEPKVLRRDAAQNRERLLDAAERVFTDYGMDASVDEIARVAGVGMGTLYRRFPTKDALISALVRKLLNDLVVIANAARDRTDGRGLEQLLYGTGEVIASQRGCLPRLWNDEETKALKAEYWRIVTELLIAAKAAGRIREDLTDTDLEVLFWAMRGVVETTRGVVDTAWKRHLALSIAGMRPGAEELVEAPLDERLAVQARTRLHSSGRNAETAAANQPPG